MGSANETSPTPRGTCTSSGGIPIGLWDFGGHGPDLLLVHATGFCASVFTPLTRCLHGHFHCYGLDLRGHGTSEHMTDQDFRWERFADDVLAAVDHLRLQRPLAIGHSCGGASLLLAEEQRPGTFAGLACFEPVVPTDDEPVLPRREGNALHDGALRRRAEFPSREAAFENFASKPPFSSLHPEALWRYVLDGFEVIPTSEGGDGKAVRLRCRPEEEAEVYAHAFSHGAFTHLASVRCPVALACGADTDAFGPEYLERYASRLADCSISVLPGLGHFGPLEDPDAVAAWVVAAFVPPVGAASPR
ncbi:MAG: alpha/beta fold hydrolase [Acidimicrobiales bacterium]